jgi:precorrin-2 dehydrogenase/sirohydrochlorin ferrochelatase
MFPVALDLAKIPILLIGDGPAFKKRHAQLLEYGAGKLTVCHTTEGRYPYQDLDVSLRWHDNNIILVTGLTREASEKIAAAGRAAGKLVNVEDMNDLCDFYFTANVKRGDLLIAISTGGASPTLARRVRDHIANKFGEEWKERTEEIKNFRTHLKANNKTTSEVLQESEKFLVEKGWLQ